MWRNYTKYIHGFLWLLAAKELLHSFIVPRRRLELICNCFSVGRECCNSLGVRPAASSLLQFAKNGGTELPWRGPAKYSLGPRFENFHLLNGRSGFIFHGRRSDWKDGRKGFLGEKGGGAVGQRKTRKFAPITLDCLVRDFYFSLFRITTVKN